MGGRNGPKIGGKPNFVYAPSKIGGAAEAQPRKLGPTGDYSPGLSPTATRTTKVVRSSSVPVFLKESAAGTKAMEMNQSKRGNSYRKLSAEEYQSRLEKGLCFRCDDRYRPNLRCKSKQLQVLIIDEEGELEESLLEDQGEVEDSEPKVELSRHSVAGLNSPETMKVWGAY